MGDLEIPNHVQPSVFGEDDDDPFAVPPPLDALPPPGEDVGDIGAVNGVLNLNDDGDATGSKETKTKKRATQPRVKLNEKRLCSPKGIAALRNLCSDIKLKGKGHEESDLNKLLQHFEHWAQCLMPKWPFENVVHQCEKLGSKRSVQNELQRVRRGEDVEVLRGEPEDEEQETGEIFGATVLPEAGLPPQQTHDQVQQLPVERPAPLTEEQLERIRKNRELALARREALQKRKMLEERRQESGQSDVADSNQMDSTLNGTGDGSSLSVNQQNDVESRTGNTETDQDIQMENTDQSYVPGEHVLTAVDDMENVPRPPNEVPEEQGGVVEDNVFSMSNGVEHGTNIDEENSELPKKPGEEDGENNSCQMVSGNQNEAEMETETKPTNEITLEENNVPGLENTDVNAGNANNFDLGNDEKMDDGIIDGSEKENKTMSQNGVGENSDATTINAKEMDTDFIEES